MIAIAPIDWLAPELAASSLAPMLAGRPAVENLLVRINAAGAHAVCATTPYRQARYGVDDNGESVWLDVETGLRLYDVTGWAIADA